jgi:hypothetical protein
MHFKLGRKKVIEATMNKGLYIVTHVAKGFEETAFILTNMQDTTENTLTSAKEKQSELTKD